MAERRQDVTAAVGAAIQERWPGADFVQHDEKGQYVYIVTAAGGEHQVGYRLDSNSDGELTVEWLLPG